MSIENVYDIRTWDTKLHVQFFNSIQILPHSMKLFLLFCCLFIIIYSKFVLHLSRKKSNFFDNSTTYNQIKFCQMSSNIVSTFTLPLFKFYASFVRIFSVSLIKTLFVQSTTCVEICYKNHFSLLNNRSTLSTAKCVYTIIIKKN